MFQGTEGGVLYVWDIPSGGLTEIQEEPTIRIPAHTDKIYSILVSIITGIRLSE